MCFEKLCSIAVCSVARMDFLAKAKKRAATSTYCEIIDIEPLSFKLSEKVDNGKTVAMVPQKRKGNMPPCQREKLMKEAFNVRAGIESL